MRRVPSENAPALRSNKSTPNVTARRFFFSLVLALLLLRLGIGIAASENQRSNQHQSKPKEKPKAIKEQEPQVPLSAFQSALRTIEQQNEAAEKEAEASKETWHSPSVLVNIALAIIGAGYLIFAALQWQVLRWAFLADHRPRLGIRHIALLTDPDEVLTPDREGRLIQNNIEVQLSLINRGASDAQIIEGNVTLTVDKIDDVESILRKQTLLPPFDVTRESPVYSAERDTAVGVIVRPAEPYFLTRRMPISGSAYDAAHTYLAIHPERNLDSVAFHVFGYFKYRTPRWIFRRWTRRAYYTAFCRRYDPKQRKFVVTNEPDYEYED